jgi:hypothetical protein
VATLETNNFRFSVLVHTPVTEEPFDPPAGVTITNVERIIYFDQEGLSLLTIAIEVGRDVVAPILALWLYERFIKPKGSKPAKETRINERLITVGARDEFIKLVEREIIQKENKEQ